MQLKAKQSKFKKFIIVLAVADALLACGKQSQSRSQLSDATIGSAAVPTNLTLGNGYSEKVGLFLTNECVTGETEFKNLPLTGGDVAFKVDASYSDIVDSLSGTLDASLNLRAIKASAGAELAKEAAKTQLTTNIFAYINLVGQAQSFKSGTRKIGSEALVPGINKETYCGTDFLNQIDYGASMGVVLEVTAKSVAQKQKIAGYLKVNAFNVVEASGKLANIDESEHQNYSVRLLIKQVGGVSQNVSLAVPSQGMFCDLSDIKVCIDKMNAALHYMRTQMRADLEKPANWNPINYHTVSYKNAVSVRTLAPQELTDAQKELLARAYDDIKARYERTMEDKKDASTIASLTLSH